ncbi:MAG: DUF4177 domain-containing protein [Erysipelotrichaceae bacterium]
MNEVWGGDVGGICAKMGLAKKMTSEEGGYIMGYQYMYVQSKVGGFFSESNHRVLIDQYAQEGWRFVSAIPSSFYGNNGQIRTFDLVFEKKNEE